MLNLITIISYNIASVTYCHDDNYILSSSFIYFMLAAKYPHEDSELEKSEIRAFQKSLIVTNTSSHYITPKHTMPSL